MRKKGLSLASIMLAILMVASVLAGCSGKGEPETTSQKEQSSNPSDKSAPKALTEIKVEIFDRGNVPPEEGTIENNRWTKWINEEMNVQGIKVTFYPIPRKEEVTKLNVLLASGDAPDMVYTYDENAFHNYAESGGLHDLTELVDTYGPNIKKFWEDNPGVKDVGMHKGKLFAITGGGPIPLGNMLYMRKDWLDAVGLGIPKTADEFYNALKAFKEKDPGNVGKDNVVPLTIATGGVGASLNVEALQSAFGIVPNDLVDGHIVPVEVQPGYKDYVVFMNKLYKEGLIAKEFALDTDGKKSKEQTFNGQVGAWSGNLNWINSISGGGNALNHEMVGKFPDVEWVHVDHFADSSGNQHKVVTTDPGFKIMIPKSSKHAIEVIKYLDWMAAKGGETLFFGLENEHYILKDGAKVPKDAEYNAKTLGYLSWDISVIRPFKYDGNYLKAVDPNPKFGEISKQAYNQYANGGTPRLSYDRTIEAQLKYGATLDKLKLQGPVKAITSDNPEKVFDEFKAEFLESGGQPYIDETTQVFKEMRNMK